MPDANAPEVPMAGGIVSSSKGPAFYLIPTEALLRLSQRFEVGVERKGDKSWNAISDNQSCLTDRAFVLDRIAHVISHALKLRDKIIAGVPLDDDDDAGAISWSGAFLCCATKAMEEADVQTTDNLKAALVRHQVVRIPARVEVK